MEKKSFISRKVMATLVAIAVFTVSFFLARNVFTPQYDGTIQVDIVDIKGTTVNEKEISFHKEDQLVDLLKENFDHVVVENGMLMSIDTLTTPEDWSEFICIYVDKEMSQVGIQDIAFQDGTYISFVMTKYES